MVVGLDDQTHCRLYRDAEGLRSNRSDVISIYNWAPMHAPPQTMTQDDANYVTARRSMFSCSISWVSSMGTGEVLSDGVPRFVVFRTVGLCKFPQHRSRDRQYQDEDIIRSRRLSPMDVHVISIYV